MCGCRVAFAFLLFFSLPVVDVEIWCMLDVPGDKLFGRFILRKCNLRPDVVVSCTYERTKRTAEVIFVNTVPFTMSRRISNRRRRSKWTYDVRFILPFHDFLLIEIDVPEMARNIAT